MQNHYIRRVIKGSIVKKQKNRYTLAIVLLGGSLFYQNAYALSEGLAVIGQLQYNHGGELITSTVTGRADEQGYYNKARVYATYGDGIDTNCLYYDSIGEPTGSRTLKTGIPYDNCPSSLTTTSSNVLPQYNVGMLYDENTGELTSLSDHTGVTKYSYYVSGKIKSVTYPDGKVISYSYDQQHALSEITDVEGNQTVYNKNDKGQLDDVYYRYDGKTYTVGYAYDDFGHIKTITMPNTTTITFYYDQYDRITEIKYTLKNDAIVDINNTYDSQDNYLKTRVIKTPFGDSNEGFTYNNMGELSNYTCSQEGGSSNLCPRDQKGNIIQSEVYHFDKFNNIIQVDETFIASKGGEKGVNTTKYSYDPTNPTRLLSYTNTNSAYPNSKVISYNALGDITIDDQGRTYTYDPFGRMLTANDAKGSELASYSYNGAGLLTGETELVGLDKIQNGQNTHSFYYANNKLINESSSSNGMTSYLLAPNKLAQFTKKGAQYFVFNQTNSIIGITDSNGTLQQQYVYSPYGIRTPIQSSEVASTIGFDGQRTDAATGYQFLGNGYRAYNPILRRFMQPDSASPFAGGGINSYEFGSNNPMLFTDPSGHFSTGAFIGNLVAALIGLGAAIAAPFTGGSSAAVAVGVISGLLGAASGISGSVAAADGDKKAKLTSNVLMGVSGVLDIASAAATGGAKIVSKLATSGSYDLGKGVYKGASDVGEDIAKSESACFTKGTPVLVLKEMKSKQPNNATGKTNVKGKIKKKKRKYRKSEESIDQIQLGQLVVVN